MQKAFLSNLKEEVDHSWDNKDVDEKDNEKHNVDERTAPILYKLPPYVGIKANAKKAYTF